MKIESIYIYPIKSLSGISLQSSNLLGRGLEHDRRWMLVDSDGVFISQRKIPTLVLFKVNISNDHLLVFSGFDNTFIQIPFLPQGNPIEVSVWDDTVEAIEVSEEVSNWFTNHLSQSVRLVYMQENSKRMIDRKYSNDLDFVSFADAFPLLLANSASLDDLNTRLTTKVNMERFRPNIVVSGSFPFEEDKWSKIRIGNSKIEVVKQCARCVMVNIDPTNAFKETEILKVLSNYRKRNNKVYFGVNALVHIPGKLIVGDRLEFSSI